MDSYLQCSNHNIHILLYLPLNESLLCLTRISYCIIYSGVIFRIFRLLCTSKVAHNTLFVLYPYSTTLLLIQSAITISPMLSFFTFNIVQLRPLKQSQILKKEDYNFLAEHYCIYACLFIVITVQIKGFLWAYCTELLH